MFSHKICGKRSPFERGMTGMHFSLHRKTERAVTHQHTSRPLYHEMTTGNKRRTAWQQLNGLLSLQWFICLVTKESRCLIMTPLSKKAKRKHVALLKVKMDCRCRKLTPFCCQFLLAVGESEKDCRHIFEQCRLLPKLLGRPLACERTIGWFPVLDTYHCWLFNKSTYYTKLISHIGLLSSR